MSITILLSGCGIYSFEGSTLHPDIKKIKINYFINTSSNSHPNLSNTLEDKLKTIFLEKSKLEITKKEEDIEISGKIIKYQITPISLNSNETASLNRIEITIQVKCKKRF